MNRRPKDINAYLTSRYYDINKPAAFTSVSKLHQAIKKEGKYDIPLNLIKEWGMSQDAITLNTRPIEKNKVRRKVVSGLRQSLWDCDLLQLNQKRFVEANDGYSYILVCVDVLSRYGHAVQLKSKGSQDVLNGFDHVLKQVNYKVRSIRTDNGKEFTNRIVKDFMKKHSINLYHTSSSTKSNYAEIFIKNIKRRLFRIFQFNNSYRYLEDLQNIIKSYNNTTHSSIGIAPADVNKKNEQEIWDRTYYPPSNYKKIFLKAVKTNGKRYKKKKNIFKYNIGDTVRIIYSRQLFDRDYDEKYTGETFTITRKRIAQGIPIYFLKDYSGEDVKGGFYSWELKKIVFNKDGLFKIDKVLKKRKRKGKSESFVHFQSWPKKYDDWVNSDNIVSLKKKDHKAKIIK